MVWVVGPMYRDIGGSIGYQLTASVVSQNGRTMGPIPIVGSAGAGEQRLNFFRFRFPHLLILAAQG